MLNSLGSDQSSLLQEPKKRRKAGKKYGLQDRILENIAETE